MEQEVRPVAQLESTNKRTVHRLDGKREASELGVGDNFLLYLAERSHHMDSRGEVNSDI